MPLYPYKCKCGRKIEVFRPMYESDDPWKCKCGKTMQHDLQAKAVRASGKDYSKPIHSDALAISPRQRAEHERTFPDIKLDNQCRPVFDKFASHEAYLKKCGLVKHPGKGKRKGKRIA